jgi:hypothetical protein
MAGLWDAIKALEARVEQLERPKKAEPSAPKEKSPLAKQKDK